MSSGNQLRTRSERVAQLELPPGQFARWWAIARRGDVLLRVGIALISALIMWLCTGYWRPPLEFRRGSVPDRDVIARVSFEVKDEPQTIEERNRAMMGNPCVYSHDPDQLVRLRDRLKDRVLRVKDAKNLDELDPEAWSEFQPPVEDGQPAPPAASQADLDAFKALFADDVALEKFDRAVQLAFEDIERYGLFEGIEHKLKDGSQTEIEVLNLTTGKRLVVQIDDVPRKKKVADFKSQGVFDSPEVADRIVPWLLARLPEKTLTFNKVETEKSAQKAADAVDDVMVPYAAGSGLLAKAGTPITSDQIRLLEAERQARIDNMSFVEAVAQFASDFGMYGAMFLLCGVFVFFRHRSLIQDLRRLTLLHVMVVVSVVLANVAGQDRWPAEIIPLMLFGMTAAIAYTNELALLLATSVCLITVLIMGQGLPQFVTLTAGIASSALLLRNIRSRTKLIYVGMAAATITIFTALGVSSMSGASLGWPLIQNGLWYGFFALMSAILMTGLLPFIEKLLDVQTDLSLLELADISHPLLQELVRRAPGTYNHSINVASIAESAAESIGANGLLVRVGAYFHDIGKMLKPQYFIENQSQDGNRHEDLLPAMSTLIIIAHVKDGADLARQHHLPQRIVDCVLQHHGTTLVEYFYTQASKQSKEDPDIGEVDEGSYRYPGPKPQTREAAVLMLADAVESASRSLQEPAPARIESLVADIAKKKLEDGQFDECELTLQDLRRIEDSLVMSLTAMYHSRVKYPDQHTA